MTKEFLFLDEKFDDEQLIGLVGSRPLLFKYAVDGNGDPDDRSNRQWQHSIYRKRYGLGSAVVSKRFSLFGAQQGRN